MPAGPTTKAEKCTRCFQPVPPGAARCPQCGEPLRGGSRRKVMLILGVSGLLIVLLLVGLGLFLQGNPADPNAPDQPASQPARPPDKPPALDR